MTGSGGSGGSGGRVRRIFANAAVSLMLLGALGALLATYADAGIQWAVGLFRAPEVSRTEVVTFNPIVGGNLVDSLTVENTVSGRCGDQASLVAGSGATRCSHGNALEYACWYEREYTDKGMESFICALSAWDKKVLRVLAPERDYEGGESLEFSRPDGRDAPQPFGVEVQDPENPGQFLRCQNLEGAKPTIGGEPAHFDCWGGGGGLPIGGAMKVTAGAVRKYEDKPWEVPVLIDDESAEIRYAKVRKVFY